MFAIGIGSKINRNFKIIEDCLLSNDNLLKLIVYSGKDASNNLVDIDTLSSIDSPPDLLDVNLFKEVKVPNAITGEKCLMLYDFDDFNSFHANSLMGSKLLIDIAIHSNLQTILYKNELWQRKHAIFNELEKMFDKKQIIGIGKTEIERAIRTFINDDFIGFKLIINIRHVK